MSLIEVRDLVYSYDNEHNAIADFVMPPFSKLGAFDLTHALASK